MIPIRPLATRDNMTSTTPGANTDFFTTDLTIPAMAHRITMTIAVSLASRLYGFCTNGSDVAIDLNGGSQLGAAQMYYITWGVRPDQTWNFQIDTAGVVRYLTIDALDTGN